MFTALNEFRSSVSYEFITLQLRYMVSEETVLTFITRPPDWSRFGELCKANFAEFAAYRFGSVLV